MCVFGGSLGCVDAAPTKHRDVGRNPIGLFVDFLFLSAFVEFVDDLRKAVIFPAPKHFTLS